MSWSDDIVPSVNSAIKWVESVSHTVAAHPWYSAAGAVLGFIFAVRLHLNYSSGMCNCATDLTGKTVVITGGNRGIGKVTAMELARRNAKVIIGCRSIERGSQAVRDIKAATGNRNVVLKQLDLCSFASVRKFAESVKETEDRLHILIENAAVTNSGGKWITEDGCQTIMQVNHLGHFLLTLLLADLMKKSAPSRIIVVSSVAHKNAVLDLQDLKSTKNSSSLGIYKNSKLANLLFTTEMSKRLEGTGVTVNALHPGLVRTDIMKNTPVLYGLEMHALAKIFFFLFGKTLLQGAQTVLHLALSPELDNVSGKYFSDCKEQRLKEIARDEHLAKKLWEMSEDIVGLKLDSSVQ